MFNSSGKQEVLALIQGWILEGHWIIDKKENDELYEEDRYG